MYKEVPGKNLNIFSRPPFVAYSYAAHCPASLGTSGVLTRFSVLVELFAAKRL
jgi:hypothetical protein